MRQASAMRFGDVQNALFRRQALVVAGMRHQVIRADEQARVQFRRGKLRSISRGRSEGGAARLIR